MLRTTLLKRAPLLLLITAMTCVLGAGASAGATTGIEGVWSFNGGQIAVQRLPNGTFAGTVVAETKFAECSHPVGQQIWTGITLQGDGSYWGLHQWYFGNCRENPVRGPTAWRILENANGSRYMRVCFSHPNTSQPTIAANGDPKQASEYAAYHVTYGCYASALIAALPVAPTTQGKQPGSQKGSSGPLEGLTLPSAKKCLRVIKLKLRLRDPKYDPFKTVTVTLNGHRIATSRKGNIILATIKLSSLRSRTFKIKVRATTVLGHHLSASRTYRICGRKKKPKKSHKKG